MIHVAVSGAAGRMGQTVCAAVEEADDMELVGRADPRLDTGLDSTCSTTPRSWWTSPSRTPRWRTRARASRPACTA